MVVSSRRQANVDKAVALLKSQSIQVTGTTCNVGKGEDREKLIQMVSLFLIIATTYMTLRHTEAHTYNYEVVSD